MWAAGHSQTVQYLGAPNSNIQVRGKMYVDSSLGLPKDTFAVIGTLKDIPWLAIKGDVLYQWSKIQNKWIAAGGTASSINWGSITGTITSQADLIAKFNAKQDTLPVGASWQYFKGDHSLGDFSSDVGVAGGSLFAPISHTHFSSDIIDLRTIVLNYLHPGSGISYDPLTGTISWPGTGVITTLNGLSGSSQTFVPSGNITIGSVGTAHTFTVPYGIDSTKSSNDSVYAKVNGSWRFQYVIAGGTGKQGFGDTATYDATKYWVQQQGYKTKAVDSIWKVADSVKLSINGVVYAIKDSTGGTSFTETIERFTGSTSATVTVAHTPLTGHTQIVFLNGIECDPNNILITGNAFTLAGIVRETSDVITIKYSY